MGVALYQLNYYDGMVQVQGQTTPRTCVVSIPLQDNPTDIVKFIVVSEVTDI